MAAARFFMILFVSASTAFAQSDDFRPLDKRTRCILLFHECLRDIANQDAEALFPKIADGGLGRKSNFRIKKSIDVLSPDLKRELSNRKEFFEKNFPHSQLIAQSFDKILFSSLTTENENAKIKISQGDLRNLQHQGGFHTIKIKIPDLDDRRFTALRFAEVEEKLYWVPFGW